MKKYQIITISLVFLSLTVSGKDYQLIKDIPYVENNVSNRQKLDIYIPGKPDSLMPCFVWIHGGAWMTGSKDNFPSEVDMLLDHNFVVVCIGYRLSYEAIFPSQIHDCKAAIRYLKANGAKYYIDSSRIAVGGASAGGHLASLVGTSGDIPELEEMSQGNKHVSSKVKAVIDFYGPSNFLMMDNLPDSCNSDDPHLHPDSPESKLLGCDITVCTEKVMQADPITYISGDDPPFLIFHGSRDCTVTPLSSAVLKDKLIKKNIKTDLYIIPGAGHGGDKFKSDFISTTILTFLNNHLK